MSFQPGSILLSVPVTLPGFAVSLTIVQLVQIKVPLWLHFCAGKSEGKGEGHAEGVF